MEFVYINEQEEYDRLLKERARSAVQQLEWYKVRGEDVDENWQKEWDDRLSTVLDEEEIAAYRKDVYDSAGRAAEMAVIQARVEGRVEAEADAIAACEALTVKVDSIKPSPVELVKEA